MERLETIKINYFDISNCPLCQGQGLLSHKLVEDQLAIEINRYLSPVTKKFPSIQNHLMRCDNCDHVFLSPRLDDESLYLLYYHWYRHGYADIFNDQKLIRRRSKQFSKYHMSFIARHVKTPGMLLDVGCGSGLFLLTARKHQWTTVGIDLNQDAVEFGRSKFGLDIRNGWMRDVLNPDELFDVITMFDYLEHSSNPSLDITLAYQYLKPGGFLFIRVPNRNSLQAKFMKQNWLGIISNHLSYFSNRSIQRFLALNHFSIKEISCKNDQHEIDIIKQKISLIAMKLSFLTQKKIANSETSLSITGSENSIKKFLYSLVIEQIDHIGGWFNMGNNLMVVAQKNE